MPIWLWFILAPVGLVLALAVWGYVRASSTRRLWAQALVTAEGLGGPGRWQRMQARWESGQPGARLGVLLALTNEPDEKALPLLEAAFDEHAVDLRAAACAALGELGTEQAGEILLRRGLPDGNSLARAAAMDALGRMRYEPATGPLAELLEQAASAGVWTAYRRALSGIRAAEALGRIGTKEANEALRAAEGRGPAGVRQAVTVALGLRKLEDEVEAGKGTVETYEKLAATCLVKRDYERARQWLERALNEDPDSGALHHLMGLIQQRTGNAEAAVESYERAIELGSLTDPFPYFGLARIHEEHGYRQRAIEEYRKYIELAPDGEQADAAKARLALLLDQQQEDQSG